MHFSQRTFKDALGATVIQSRLQPAPGRHGFEKLMFPGMPWACSTVSRSLPARHGNSTGEARGHARQLIRAPRQAHGPDANFSIAKPGLFPILGRGPGSPRFHTQWRPICQ